MLHRASIGVPALRQVPLFQALDDEQIGQISLLLKERRYHKGATIFHQGDPGGCLYLVISGRVRIFLNSADGREATVRFYGSNSAFGEFSVLDGEPRSASAAAVDDVTSKAGSLAAIRVRTVDEQSGKPRRSLHWGNRANSAKRDNGRSRARDEHRWRQAAS